MTAKPSRSNAIRNRRAAQARRKWFSRRNKFFKNFKLQKARVSTLAFFNVRVHSDKVLRSAAAAPSSAAATSVHNVGVGIRNNNGFRSVLSFQPQILAQFFGHFRV